jgi:hypothetical protein
MSPCDQHPTSNRNRLLCMVRHSAVVDFARRQSTGVDMKGLSRLKTAYHEYSLQSEVRQEEKYSFSGISEGQDNIEARLQSS